MTGEQLAWFVRGEAAATGSDMSHIIAQLERLHVALQVVVALRTYLNLSLTSLTHFTAQVWLCLVFLGSFSFRWLGV